MHSVALWAFFARERGDHSLSHAFDQGSFVHFVQRLGVGGVLVCRPAIIAKDPGSKEGQLLFFFCSVLAAVGQDTVAKMRAEIAQVSCDCVIGFGLQPIPVQRERCSGVWLCMVFDTILTITFCLFLQLKVSFGQGK